MPNAAASLDADYGTFASGRRKPAGKPRPKPASRRKGRFSLDRVARYGAVAISITVGVGIVVNALMMQHGHHPAPLFSTAKPAVPKPGVARPALTEPAVAEPTSDIPATEAAVPAAGIAHKAAQAVQAVQEPPREHAIAARNASVPPKAAQAAVRVDDPIARLLGGTPAASLKTDIRKTEGKTVTAAQQALGKLGFPVKATGTSNAATRAAVEAFEKSRHLPVKGELSRRVLRVLAAESGVRID